MKTDYEFIKSNDFEGMIKKYDKYINHYAKSVYYTETEDTKQDLLIETLNLWNWVNKDKINEKFDFKHFLFQKFNAYKKNKRSKENKYIAYHTFHEECDYLDETQNIETTFFYKTEFPETLSKIEREIYFRNILSSSCIKTLCKEYNISYSKFCDIKADVIEKLNRYI